MAGRSPVAGVAAVSVDVRQVRKLAAQHSLQGHTALADLLADMADEVERLRAEVDRLRDES